MKLRKLLTPALVLPERDPVKLGIDWAPTAVGTGSVVEIVTTSVSPLGVPEIYVELLDAVGRRYRGWLAARTTLASPSINKRLIRETYDGSELGPWDQLRETIAKWLIFHHGADVIGWLASEGSEHVPLLRSAIRELGGRVNQTDSTPTTLAKAARVITGREVDMVTEVQQSAKSKAKSARASGKHATPAKAKGKSEGTRAKTAWVGVGVLVLAALPSGAPGRATAEAMSKNHPQSKSALIALRDSINEAGVKARAAKQDKVATALAQANRGVRRLYRSL